MRRTAIDAITEVTNKPVEVPIEEIIAVASSGKAQLLGTGLFNKESAAIKELERVLTELGKAQGTALSQEDLNAYRTAVVNATEPSQRFVNSFSDFAPRLTEVNTELTSLLDKSDTKFTRLKGARR